MMESLSSTLDTYTSSYMRKRRKRKLIIGAAVGAGLVAVAVLVFLLTRPAASGTAAQGRPIAKTEILASWKARNWDKVLADSRNSLQNSPLDSFYLAFSGLAAFYKGVDLPEGEERAALMDESVMALRKTLVVATKTSTAGLPKAELEYVLGKAYYFKGQSYFDQMAAWLERSIADGYLADDSREYLAVAYAGLGQTDKALESFNAALGRKKSDLLLIAAGKAYLDAGKSDRAEALLLEALASSSDVLAREKCRFLLATIYEARGETKKVQEQLELVLGENADSAEAHYRLGLVFQKSGDPIKARAEWRRAVSIDPMHAAARQKLTEKL